jgi:hypothetical protein
MEEARPEAVIETRGLRRVFRSRQRQVEAVAGDPSVIKGVVILVVLSAVAVVIGARQFGRAVS